MEKVFYKGKIYTAKSGMMNVRRVDDCYSYCDIDGSCDGTEYVCVIELDGVDTIVPYVGCKSSCTSDVVDLGEIDLDGLDKYSLEDIILSNGYMINPIEYFLIDQPIDECDIVAECHIGDSCHKLYVKVSESINSQKIQDSVNDATEMYRKRRTSDSLKSKLNGEARMFRYKMLGNVICDDSYATATTSEGSSMLKQFNADEADKAEEYLKENEGSKIVKSDESGIYIGNEDIDESSVENVQEVSDSKKDKRFSLITITGIVDSIEPKLKNAKRWDIAGDVRRQMPDYGSLKIVVDCCLEDFGAMYGEIEGDEMFSENSMEGNEISFVCCGVPCEIICAEGTAFIPTMLYETGTDGFNVELSALASLNGYYMLENGICGEDGEFIDFEDEESLFDTIGAEYVEPSKRNFI